MKLCSLLLFIVVTKGQYNQENYFLCQQWCYKYDNFGSIFLTCCHMTVRHGSCPTGCIFGYGADIHQLLCQIDGNCPMGYKCCADKCSYFQKICKPIVYPVICEAPPTTSPPVTQPPIICPTESRTTTHKPPTESPNHGSEEITTTESNSEQLPTVVYDENGSGSWELVNEDDDEASGDDEWEFITTRHNDATEEHTQFTTKAVKETTIYEEDVETTMPVDDEITIHEEQWKTTPTIPTIPTIPTTPTTPKIDDETTIREEVETTLKPEEETTTLEVIIGSGSGSGSGSGNGSGSGSGDGDDDDDGDGDDIILPPAAFRSNNNDDFYYDHL